MSARIPRHRYVDPLDRIWLACAARLGFRVVRSAEAYASTDGRRTIVVGTPETLDADDSLAQMILHELCHALVEGPDGEARVDWGLDNTSDRDTWKEHACLRLQAHLTGAHGLRGLFAPTTDYRVSFWDGLGEDPLAAAAEAGGRREPSVVAAKVAVWRAGRSPWAGPLQDALRASAAVAAAVAAAGGADGGVDDGADGGVDDNDHDARPRRTSTTTSATTSTSTTTTTTTTTRVSLWTTVVVPPARHMLGHDVVAPVAGETCGGCAWLAREGRTPKCRQVAGKANPAWPACVRWEPAVELDCLTCGACCREAYHSVEISRREPVIKRHPQLVVVHETFMELRRDGERCAALGGGRTPLEPYACAIYDDRPRTCREFTLGSANCLDARRRVGLSL